MADEVFDGQVLNFCYLARKATTLDDLIIIERTVVAWSETDLMFRDGRRGINERLAVNKAKRSIADAINDALNRLCQ